jgi:PAS domain-containing protein
MRPRPCLPHGPRTDARTGHRGTRRGCTSQCPPSSLHWVDASIVPMAGDDGRPERFVAIRTDITERKRAEAALRKQLHFRAELLDAIPVAIYYKDARGRFLGMNRAL